MLDQEAILKGITAALLTNIRLGWNGLPGTNPHLLVPVVSYEENKVLRFWLLGSYPQHSILVITYKYFQQAGVLDYTWPEKHQGDKHSNLSDPIRSLQRK
jgi:hypothetical protein